MALAGPCALCPVAVNCRAEPVVKPAGGLGAAAIADNVGAVTAVDAAVSILKVAGERLLYRLQLLNRCHVQDCYGRHPHGRTITNQS